MLLNIHVYIHLGSPPLPLFLILFLFLPSSQPYLNEARQQLSQGDSTHIQAELQPVGTSVADSATLPQPFTALPHDYPHVCVPGPDSSGGGHQLEHGSERRALPQGWHSEGAMDVDPTYSNIPRVEKQPGVGVACEVCSIYACSYMYVC